MTIRISESLWQALIKALHQRGSNSRETGAFVLGTRNSATTDFLTFVPYEELDPTSAYHPYIRFNRSGFVRLWTICRSSGMDVVGDIHTHPYEAFQSHIDRANPMIPTAGHLALIIPRYAAAPVTLGSIGIYEYLGNAHWRTLSDASNPHPVLEVTRL